jgi:hypothetical protein
MKLSLITLCCALTLIAVSCGGGSGTVIIPGTGNQLQLTTWQTGGDTVTLNLNGPGPGSVNSVSYYIFGSHNNLGDNALVPLQADRLDEQLVVTLAAQESLDDVDLSPWDAYEFVYLRAISVTPNRIHLIAPGFIYEFGVL